MMSSARLRLVLAAVATTAILAGCAQPAPPPPPPAPPPVPSVSLSNKLLDQASAYRAYVDRAAQISPAFTDGANVAQSLKTGESYEPGQFLRGAIAYGAVVALQDPAFRAGVRTYAADADQRRTVAYSIMKDPAYVLGITGAQSAAGLVTSALGDDGKKLLDQGRAVKQAAYDVQHYAWSKSDVAARESRLAMAKQLSATPISGSTDITAKLELAVAGSQPMTLAADPASPPYTPLVVRSLAVAALGALGYADDASLEQVMPLTAEPASAQCLNMSKLNLYQCLAVAKPHYEDVFCLGQHVLMDTGQCLMKGVGVAEPAPPPPPVQLTPVSTKGSAKGAKSRARTLKGKRP
ncbi:hypothetical protein DJ017_07005 [Phenylobacterium soli]|uniref:Uncharacterized protein n=2 Tax=Phenylobacterium soli TaxID=2170551 RepID=A0A328AID5_9CAUL|nr:hypothetical protein DJ017_07005 [Phenylobacterium soli]